MIPLLKSLLFLHLFTVCSTANSFAPCPCLLSSSTLYALTIKCYFSSSSFTTTHQVVKQTVMTTVYGVTWVGGREQIQRQLTDQGIFKEEDIFRASAYLTTLVFMSLGQIFERARKIQVRTGRARCRARKKSSGICVVVTRAKEKWAIARRLQKSRREKCHNIDHKKGWFCHNMS